MGRQAFVVTVMGEMDEHLRNEFEHLEIAIEHGVTRLRVVSVDPSVLHGVLNRIHLLGLELLDAHQVDPGSPGEW